MKVQICQRQSGCCQAMYDVARLPALRRRGFNFLKTQEHNFETHVAKSIVGFFVFERKHMKNRYISEQQVKTRFGPETRFEIGPIPPVPFRGTLENELDALKARLLTRGIGARRGAGVESAPAPRRQRSGQPGVVHALPVAGLPGAS